MNLKEVLVENDSIRLKVKVNDWKEAIKLGVDLLVKSGAVENKYYDAIIKNTNEYGPYYIIVPEVAMPHARPENGVLKDSFSLITLEEPVYFELNGEKKEVFIFLTLAATSTENHNEFGIVQVAELFENEENVEKIKNAREISEVLELI